MKYLLVAIACLLGLIAISIRDSDLSEIGDIHAELVPDVLESEEGSTEVKDPEWSAYWNAGLAEISGYDLKQSRYGEIHDGLATLIFVTEPFSKKKQVKLDNPSEAGNDSQAVLKLNSTRKFLTGIYPYSMMTSVFNPVNTEKYENAAKLTVSGQEWCGQVFMQLNERGNKYDIKSYSYFEAEGDQNFSIDQKFLEDEFFNIIRLNPSLLPMGEIKVISSAVASRFMHEDLKPYNAIASLGTATWKDKELSQYSLKYAHSKRVVNIYFQPKFPHVIEGWEDTYQGFGKEPLTTVAVRKNTKMLDYWNKHDNADRHLNQELYEKD